TRYSDRRRPVATRQTAILFYRLPLRRTWIFSLRRPIAKADLGCRLAHGAPRCPRHLHAHALLRAHAVHRRHPHPGADLLHCRGRRPPRAAGDPVLQRFAHSRRSYAKPLSLIRKADHSYILVALDWHGARFLDVPE